jgi:hypothetical protein
VIQIREANRKGRKVQSLLDQQSTTDHKPLDYENVIGEDSLTRFDQKAKKSERKKRKKGKRKHPKRNQ